MVGLLSDKVLWALKVVLQRVEVKVIDSGITSDSNRLYIRCRSQRGVFSIRDSAQVQKRLSQILVAGFSLFGLEFPASRFEKLSVRGDQIFLFFKFLPEDELVGDGGELIQFSSAKG